MNVAVPSGRLTLWRPVTPPTVSAASAEHVLICRFGASPGEPQPSMAPTNKCLAQRNKTRMAKANKRQEKPYRQRHFGRLAKLANGHLWLSLGRDAQLR